MVSQCPRCELRFPSKGEVRDHLVAEHGVDPETLADPTPSLAREVRPARRRERDGEDPPRR
jgi:hypothetical protein